MYVNNHWWNFWITPVLMMIMWQGFRYGFAKNVGEEDWVSNTWIIQNLSGICMFEASFMEIDMDSELISGFLMAIQNFGKQLTKTPLDHIAFKSLRLTLLVKEDIIVIIATVPNAEESEIYTLLNDLEDKFLGKYQQILKEWDNDVSKFYSFKEDVETIIRKEAIFEDLYLLQKPE